MLCHGLKIYILNYFLLFHCQSIPFHIIHINFTRPANFLKDTFPPNTFHELACPFNSLSKIPLKSDCPSGLYIYLKLLHYLSVRLIQQSPNCYSCPHLLLICSQILPELPLLEKNCYTITSLLLKTSSDHYGLFKKRFQNLQHVTYCSSRFGPTLQHQLLLPQILILRNPTELLTDPPTNSLILESLYMLFSLYGRVFSGKFLHLLQIQFNFYFL